MGVPAFIKQKDNKLLYNGEGEFVFYVPDDYFGDVKVNPIAQVLGQYVAVLGIIDWAIVSKNGSVTPPRNFFLPTIFTCKPYDIEKVRDFKINKNGKVKDYRILHFKPGDEIVSDTHIPKLLDHVEAEFKMMVINGDKIPPTVRYDKMQEYFRESIILNGTNYNINMQMFGILIGGFCRDRNDLSKPFRYTSMNDMTNYQQLSVRNTAKYISPYVAFTSENFDESLMASVLLSDTPDKDIKETPLEKVLTS